MFKPALPRRILWILVVQKKHLVREAGIVDALKDARRYQFINIPDIKHE
ncbi:MAG: hypothetical protein H0A75_06210 [Candidatus Methanofishera endochildressiae]|uniref:Uncharacterized protein n=1 Tax=Candidatus Methanofishera endochildressiae TaxID=2738884 RepID=A0A7Z0MP98_9GAMM|nr:hypothetical protein [Candidatus Methanofishera endochildressiae]